MAHPREESLTPQLVFAEIKKNGVTHVISLPDSETNWLYPLLKAEPSVLLIAVAREGFAFSAAAGLSLGGKIPMIMIQNTGMMESGDSLRGWALGFRIPVVLMLGYRGWTRRGATPDTAAVYTEPVLNAFGIKYYFVEKDDDVPRISIAFKEAKKREQPVAVLFGDEAFERNKTRFLSEQAT